jgi:hypothetical protein
MFCDERLTSQPALCRYLKDVTLIADICAVYWEVQIIQKLVRKFIRSLWTWLSSREGQQGWNERNLQSQTRSLFQMSLTIFVVCSEQRDGTSCVARLCDALFPSPWKDDGASWLRPTPTASWQEAPFRFKQCLSQDKCLMQFEDCLQWILRRSFREQRDTEVDVVSGTVTAAASASVCQLLTWISCRL